MSVSLERVASREDWKNVKSNINQHVYFRTQKLQSRYATVGEEKIIFHLLF